METLEKEFKANKISALFNYNGGNNTITIAGKTWKYIYFHKYTHADKAIKILKELGYTVKSMLGKERQWNYENAYFRYFVVIELPLIT